ncbi:zinc-binding alcohol dehydrogenase family protein [Marinomonas colpomeniae]|uniref:Zinc-binding alcohol dehydrogenase family protein n=1 Tax=Marinomonas colpomeniae TaxID=2774408 RepID=A0ABR8NXU5_9GAMM|nr:zinc-binding alcohol dehydrogenase family protein [Marinomonas colpomeniae]MBD5770858.1 zinc-binding alcohol dehydrogenase family protein [Marinomonas colpomeniae]
MKSVFCIQPGVMEIHDTPRPEDKPGHVIIKIKHIGVCGTDIHAFAGQQPFFQYPRVLGHELSGLIDSVGDGVNMAIGQHVYVIPYMACGNCIACRHSKPNCCTDIQVIGVHVDGGMCEYLQVPVEYVVETNNMPLDQMAVVECLAIGAHAVRRSELQANTNVLVVGAGPIGMGIAQFAKERGARVIMMDTNKERLDFCKNDLHVDDIVLAGSEATEQLAKLTDDEFLMSVFDATGNPKAMESCFQWVAHGGRLILVSVVKANIQFADPEFHKREMSVIGSRNATKEDFEHVIKCLREERVVAASMITHRGGLLDLPTLLPLWSKSETGVIKALIEV